ncbi:MAG: HAMP domain-containing sensor histidine kinase, partial [Acidobacteria bacterium]|nr:HAMP domain-containing sensor histidine kinase [Acidobacteriota bacterium]
YSGDSREIVVRLSRESDAVVLAVSDRGIGIPREEQEKIFDRFHRVSTGLVHDVKGSGLGLSLVHHIVEVHGGKITVDSEPGKGSTFSIRLPLDRGPSPEAASDGPAPEAPGSSKVAPAGLVTGAPDTGSAAGHATPGGVAHRGSPAGGTAPAPGLKTRSES